MNEITLSAESPRYADWMRIFGSATVPVTAPVPQSGRLEVGGPVRTFFLVDLGVLSADQMERLVAFVSERHGVPIETVRATVRDHGFPLLADDCTARSDSRWFL